MGSVDGREVPPGRPMIRYSRTPSSALSADLALGGLLSPLLVRRTVHGLLLDVHLREKDHVHVYCGLTKLVDARSAGQGVTVSAAKSYLSQPCGAGLFKTWSRDESGFAEALDRYLSNVAVRSAHVVSEGAVQAAWAGITSPWTPFDREAVFGYDDTSARRSGRSFPSVQEARDEIEVLRRRGCWAPVPVGKVGAELDQIAVDPNGRLVLVELKHAGASEETVYYAPLQLLQYCHEWAVGFETVRADLCSLIQARQDLGLSPVTTPNLRSGLRPVIGLGQDTRSAEVRSRFEKVRAIVNRHLPSGASPIEVWALEARTGPKRIA